MAKGGKRRAPAITSRIMAAVRSKDTKPEMRLRRALFALGYRYRVHHKGIAGRPDIAFPARRVAIFVDGDYWHGNGWKQRGFKSLEDQFNHCRNTAFWIEKIKGNVARDRKVNKTLKSQGWTVVRVWESQIDKSFDRCLRRITEKLGATRLRP